MKDSNFHRYLSRWIKIKLCTQSCLHYFFWWYSLQKLFYSLINKFIFRGYETQDLSLWLGIEYLLEDYDEEENVEDDGKFL